MRSPSKLVLGLCAGVALWVGQPAEAAAPAYLFNGTESPLQVQLDRQRLLKAVLTLQEVESETLEETDNRLVVVNDQQPVIGWPPAIIVAPGKALRITMDNPQARIMEFFTSPDHKLPFASTASNPTQLNLVPKREALVESKQGAGLPALKSKSSSCAIL